MRLRAPQEILSKPGAMTCTRASSTRHRARERRMWLRRSPTRKPAPGRRGLRRSDQETMKLVLAWLRLDCWFGLPAPLETRHGTRIQPRRSLRVLQLAHSISKRRDHLPPAPADDSRSAKPHFAEERDRNELALRKAPSHVHKVSRHHNHVGFSLQQVRYSCSKLSHLLP